MSAKDYIKFKIVFALGSVTGASVLQGIVEALNLNNLPSELFVSGKKVSINSLLKIIEKKISWPSGIETNGIRMGYGVLPAFDQGFLSLKQTGNSNQKAWSVIQRCALEFPGVIQAWVSSVDYDLWQNATDPLEYVSSGRSIKNLPVKSNELPPPLEQLEIDVSKNPGRIEIKHGYVEAVGNPLWISDLFCGRLKKIKEEIVRDLRNEGFSLHEHHGLLKISAPDAVFSDESTSKEQNLLRHVLFS